MATIKRKRAAGGFKEMTLWVLLVAGVSEGLCHGCVLALLGAAPLC